MTKVSVFGQQTEKKKGNPIEFVKVIEYDGTLLDPIYKPSKFKNLQLLRKNEDFDTILAWDDNCEPLLYLGHWNDGFVE